MSVHSSRCSREAQGRKPTHRFLKSSPGTPAGRRVAIANGAASFAIQYLTGERNQFYSGCGAIVAYPKQTATHIDEKILPSVFCCIPTAINRK
jgi:hypothetical protein